jgi:uroporphyrin-III C-methyltransferase
MAGKQLAALSRRLVEAGWPGDTPGLVVSRAGWPDQIATEHTVRALGDATLLHSGRPTVVTVGVGAAPIGAAREQVGTGRVGERASTGTAPADPASNGRARAGTSTP